MKKQIQALIADLEKVQTKAQGTLSDFPGISDGLTQQLERPLNFLRSKIGLSAEVGENAFPVITKLRNSDYEPGQQPQKKVDLKEVKQKAEINDVEELKALVDNLELLFLKIESDEILDEHPDLVIRGVAKRAGLPVTEDNPKKLSVKYIDEIKATIIKNKELEHKD